MNAEERQARVDWIYNRRKEVESELTECELMLGCARRTLAKLNRELDGLLDMTVPEPKQPSWEPPKIVPLAEVTQPLGKVEPVVVVKNNKRVVGTVSPEMVDDWVHRYVREDEPIHKIAASTPYSAPTITYWLRKRGIEIKRRNQFASRYL